MGQANDDEEGDFIGGMTERNVETARKLIPDTDGKKNPEQDDAVLAVEPAINHDPETDAKPITLGKLVSENDPSNEKAAAAADDSDDSDLDSSRSVSKIYEKPKDAREIIQAAIAATNQPIKITWENITFKVEVSKP